MSDLFRLSSSDGSVRFQPPAWLDSWRMDDAHAAQAYEQTPAPRRALLKTAIALHVQLWGEAPAEEIRRVASSARGFVHARADRPAAWTLAVVDPAHAAPARLLAALLPAALAGVEAIMVVFPERQPTPPLSVALELAGLENVYVLPATANPGLPDVVRELAARAEGRMLLFPTARSRLAEPFMSLRETARRQRIRLWQDRPEPRIAVAGQPGPDAQNLLRWAHGDAVLAPVSAFSPQAGSVDRAKRLDACWAPAPEMPVPGCPLILTPGLEAFWLADRLDRGFFRTFTHTVGLFPQKEQPL